jgi:hypothetical protein
MHSASPLRIGLREEQGINVKKGSTCSEGLRRSWQEASCMRWASIRRPAAVPDRAPLDSARYISPSSRRTSAGHYPEVYEPEKHCLLELAYDAIARYPAEATTNLGLDRSERYIVRRATIAQLWLYPSPALLQLASWESMPPTSPTLRLPRWFQLDGSNRSIQLQRPRFPPVLLF